MNVSPPSTRLRSDKGTDHVRLPIGKGSMRRDMCVALMASALACSVVMAATFSREPARAAPSTPTQGPSPACAGSTWALHNPTAYLGTIHVKNPAVGFAVSERAGHVFALSSTDPTASPRQPLCTGTLTMLDARTGQRLRSVDLGTYLGATAMDDPLDRLVALHTAGRRSGQMEVIDTRSGTTVARIAGRGCPCFVVVSTYAGMAFLSAGGIIRVVALRTGRVVKSIRQSGQLVADDHGRVYVSTVAGIAVLDAATGRQLALFRPGPCGGQLAIDTHLERLYTASEGRQSADPYKPALGLAGYFCVIDARNGRVLYRESAGPGASAAIVAVDEPTGVILTRTYGQFLGPVKARNARDGRVIRDVTSLIGVAPLTIDVSSGRLYFFCARGCGTAGPTGSNAVTLATLETKDWRAIPIASGLPPDVSAIAVDGRTQRSFLEWARRSSRCALRRGVEWWRRILRSRAGSSRPMCAGGTSSSDCTVRLAAWGPPPGYGGPGLLTLSAGRSAT